MRAHTERTRDRAIEGLLLGFDLATAAKYANMGRRTLTRWLAQDDTFRAQLDRGRQKLFDLHIVQLAEVTGSAIRRVRQILDNDNASPRDWLRAAELVLVQARATEEVSIRQELRELREEVMRQQV